MQSATETNTSKPVLFRADDPPEGFLPVSFRQSARYAIPLFIASDEDAATLWISDEVLLRGCLSECGISQIRTETHKHPCSESLLS